MFREKGGGQLKLQEFVVSSWRFTGLCNWPPSGAFNYHSALARILATSDSVWALGSRVWSLDSPLGSSLVTWLALEG